MVDNHQQRVADRDGRFLASPSNNEPLVLSREVGVLGVDGSMSSFHQSRTEEGDSLCASYLRDVCLHSHSFQGISQPTTRACRALGKRLMSGPISARITSAKRRLMPGIVESRWIWCAYGSQPLGD